MNLTRLSVGILWPLGNVSSFSESVGNSSNILLVLPILEESMREWGSPLPLRCEDLRERGKGHDTF